MYGNNRPVPAGETEDFQDGHEPDARESFPAREYSVPGLEEAYRDDLMRGAAYLV